MSAGLMDDMQDHLKVIGAWRYFEVLYILHGNKNDSSLAFAFCADLLEVAEKVDKKIEKSRSTTLQIYKLKEARYIRGIFEHRSKNPLNRAFPETLQSSFSTSQDNFFESSSFKVNHFIYLSIPLSTVSFM